MRANEHIRNKMLLPGHFVDESNLLAGFRRRSTVAIKDVGLFQSVEMGYSLGIELVKDFWSGRTIDIIPVNVLSRLRTLIVDDPLVLRRTTSVLSGIDRKSFPVFSGGYLSFVVRLFVLKELLEGQVAMNSGWSSDAKRVYSGLVASIGALDVLSNVVCITRLATSSLRWINSEGALECLELFLKGSFTLILNLLSYGKYVV